MANTGKLVYVDHDVWERMHEMCKRNSMFVRPLASGILRNWLDKTEVPQIPDFTPPPPVTAEEIIAQDMQSQGD